MKLALTPKAVEKVKEILVQQEMSLEKSYLRVGIRGQTCSGTAYSFGLEDEDGVTENDVKYVQDEINIVNEKQFTDMLEGVTVDFKEEADGRKGFTFSHPLQILSGCGGGGSCGGGGCQK